MSEKTVFGEAPFGNKSLENEAAEAFQIAKNKVTESSAYKKYRKVPVITKKLLIGGIILMYVIFLLLQFTNNLQFGILFRRHYDQTINSIALSVLSELDAVKIEGYLATGKKDSDYNETTKLLNDFVTHFNLRFISVSRVSGENYTDVTYIYNAVNPNSEWVPYDLGYTETYVEKGYNEAARKVFTAGQGSVIHVYFSRSGPHIEAMLPVFDGSGRPIALLDVERDLNEFSAARGIYNGIAFFMALLFLPIIIFGASKISGKFLIKPILEIKDEAVRFATENTYDDSLLKKITTNDELQILAETLVTMEAATLSYVNEIQNITKDKQRIQSDLDMAAKIQSDALQQGYPAFPGETRFDLCSFMKPAREVGGDLYGYSFVDDDHLALYVGDVSGKGIPASLFMMSAKIILDFLAKNGYSPSEAFEFANTALSQNNKNAMFITCWMGIIDLKTYELTYTNAGHPSPVLVHEGHASCLDGKAGFILAALDDAKYSDSRITLSPGDSLLIYTDGITEANNEKGELFDEARLLDTVSMLKDMNTNDIVKGIKSALDGFVGTAEQFDDITMLCFKQN